MCIYTLKKTKIKKIKKFLERGARLHRTFQNFGISGVKDTAKTNKD